MKRRTFLLGIPLGIASFVAGRQAWREFCADGCGSRTVPSRPGGEAVLAGQPTAPVVPVEAPKASASIPVVPVDPPRDEGSRIYLSSGSGSNGELTRINYIEKTRDFDRDYPDDFYLRGKKFEFLQKASAHLQRTQTFVGYGHFNLIGLDELIMFGRNYAPIGPFSREELEFLEELFFADATQYGFYGEKVVTDLQASARQNEVKKIAGTGHYLFRGRPLDNYRRIRRDLGESVTLTSGVRGLIKQYHLFLAKAVRTAGNLSRASRSLAPPGYSYHGRGDFDIGKVGFGLNNFTEEFSRTDEFKKLIDLGYVSIRYTEANPFGVRHEPWHIKIA